MMQIFGICAGSTLQLCLGAAHIGSCGLGHRTQHNCCLTPNGRVLLQPNHAGRTPIHSLFPKVSAVNSTGVGIVQVALTNISAINVALCIHLTNAIFVLQPKMHPVPSTPLLPSPILPTPININRLIPFLGAYEPARAQYLINGFQCGFPIHFEGTPSNSVASNLLSARLLPHIVDAKLTKELAAHRLAGPFDDQPLPQFRVSPLGVVPKKVQGEYCLIHHLSYPNGTSVNDGISYENSTVSYARIDDAVTLIKKVGSGSFLAKTDIKNAFRIIPIRPEDYNLLGMFWKGKYYYDRCMPMGCSSSCSTFEAFSTAIEWIAKHNCQIKHMLHLLDDFLIVAPSLEHCHSQLVNFLNLCEYLGIPMAPEKTVGPSNVLSFAGIELDTCRMEARLPNDKLLKCISLISDFMQRNKVTLRELQSLIGTLNFACSVVVPGRAFLRRLINLTKGAKRAHHYIRLNRSTKADLVVWQTFLHDFNGRSFFLQDGWFDSDTLQLYTDASGSCGFGAVFGNYWCYGEWPGYWKSLNIAILEFFPILLSILLWGSSMRNRRIIFFTDNLALVSVINNTTSRDATLLMFVRRLVLACLGFNILFRARHVPGIHNELADSLSRLQMQRFKRLAPACMHPSPTVIPPDLLPQNWQV